MIAGDREGRGGGEMAGPKAVLCGSFLEQGGEEACCEGVAGAYGFDDVDSVMAGWMRSPGHRRNILGKFSEIGVGRAIARDGASYWCVTFGTPLDRGNSLRSAGRGLSFR